MSGWSNRRCDKRIVQTCYVERLRTALNRRRRKSLSLISRIGALGLSPSFESYKGHRSVTCTIDLPHTGKSLSMQQQNTHRPNGGRRIGLGMLDSLHQRLSIDGRFAVMRIRQGE